MSNPSLNRRQFLHRSLLATAATAFLHDTANAAGLNWEIGCFNRPWGNWSYDDALDGMKEAGFKLTGIVGRHKLQPEELLSTKAANDYLDKLKERIHQRSLKPVMAWINGPSAKNPDDVIKELSKLTDNAKRLGVGTLLSGGPRRGESLEDYARAMSGVAAYAADVGVKLCMKPHGGTGEEVRRCLELANHPNFMLWYDAGNVIYYKGEDPVGELKQLASKVTGFCAKDCAAKGSPVMIQFGTGMVDFKAVFGVLAKAGFKGPVMIECTGEGASAKEVTQLAIANRDFLKRAFAAL